MGDWIELEQGEIVDRSYPEQSGRYHHDSYLKLANATAKRRGRVIELLRAQLPSNSPYKNHSVSELDATAKKMEDE